MRHFLMLCQMILHSARSGHDHHWYLMWCQFDGVSGNCLTAYHVDQEKAQVSLGLTGCELMVRQIRGQGGILGDGHTAQMSEIFRPFYRNNIACYNVTTEGGLHGT